MDTNRHLSLLIPKAPGDYIYIDIYQANGFLFILCMYRRRVRQFVLVYYDNTVNVTGNTTKKGMYYIDNRWHAPPHHNNSPYPVYSIAPVEELSSRRYAPLSWLCSHGKRLPSWAR